MSIKKRKVNLKKPWLTIGIDVRTRMIWTWYISFEVSNSVSVAKSIVRGFLPKSSELKRLNIDFETIGKTTNSEQISSIYPIYGVPRVIQYDNAKEFDSTHVKEFCRSHGVYNVQFRPTKRPDTGPFVERMFGTIRSWLITCPGYNPPLKERPEGITPEEEAVWTLAEFEEWLVKKFIGYHYTFHEGLRKEHGVKRKPITQFDLDLDGRMPPIPSNSEILQFEIYPFKDRVITSRGIQWLNTHYNDEILNSIRKRNRGKKCRIRMRYNIQDITSIWVFDNEKHLYINVKASGGLLGRFVRKYPNLSVNISEYKAVRKELSNQEISETPENIKKLLLETERVAVEARKERKFKKDRTKQINSNAVKLIIYDEKDEDDEEEVDLNQEEHEKRVLKRRGRILHTTGDISSDIPGLKKITKLNDVREKKKRILKRKGKILHTSERI